MKGPIALPAGNGNGEGSMFVGTSNTRIHEAKAVGLQKGNPTFILAIGKFLDHASNFNCGPGGENERSTHRKTILADPNRNTLSTKARQYSADNNAPSLMIASMKAKAGQVLKGGCRNQPHRRHGRGRDYHGDDPATITTQSSSSDDSQDVRIAPTSMRRRIMNQRPIRGGKDEQRDDYCSLSPSEDSSILYDTNPRDTLSDDASAVTIRSGRDTMGTFSTHGRETGGTFSTHGRDTGGTFSNHDRETGGTFSNHDRETGGTFSSHDRDTIGTWSTNGRDTTETFSAGDRETVGTFSAHGRETMGTLSAGDQDTMGTFSAGDVLTVNNDSSYDSSLADKAKHVTSFGSMIQRTMDLTAETGAEFLETLAEQLNLFPADSSYDSLEDMESARSRPHPTRKPKQEKSEDEQMEVEATLIDRTPKWKRRLRKVKPYTVSKVKSALKKIKLPKLHPAAAQNRHRDIAVSAILAHWITVARQQIQRKEVLSTLAPSASDEKADIDCRDPEGLQSDDATKSSVERMNISPHALKLQRKSPGFISISLQALRLQRKRLARFVVLQRRKLVNDTHGAYRSCTAWTCTRWRDSEPRRAAKVAQLRQLKVEQLRRLRIVLARISEATLGRLSTFQNTADIDKCEADKEVATTTIQCSNANENQDERELADDYIFQRHSTTVSVLTVNPTSDPSVVDSAIEVTLDVPAPSPIMSQEMDADALASAEQEVVPIQADVDEIIEAVEPRQRRWGSKAVASSDPPMGLFARKPDWLMRIEHQTLRIVCKVLATGSMRIKLAKMRAKMTKKAFCKNWMSPQRR